MVALIKEKFICVAVDAYRQAGRKDAIGELARKEEWICTTANGMTAVITPRGKKLGYLARLDEKNRLASLETILQAWAALPENDRKPGQAADFGPIDTQRAAVPAPPADCLVIRTWNRQLERQNNGQLRYTQAEDYPERWRSKAGRFREAAQDFMWVPKKDWSKFIRKDAKKGDTFAAPDAFVLRLLRHHLDPQRGITEGDAFGNAKADSGRIDVIVEEATPQNVRLRLEGSAKLSGKIPNDGTSIPFNYEPMLLGYLSYDPRTETIGQWKVVALGDVNNTPGDGPLLRPGTHPLGIAFELVRQPTTAERLVPRGARYDVEAYLQIRALNR